MNLIQARAGIEAMIFASLEPVSIKTLSGSLGLDERTVQQIVLDLVDEYRSAKRGIQIVESAGGFSFMTHPECAGYVEKLQRIPRNVPLSQAALETLAIIAYRQPITRAEIDAIRGVRSESALNTLAERSLIEEAGRRDAPGRPVLFVTTSIFLRHFGLRSLGDLPALEEWAAITGVKGETDHEEATLRPEA